MASSIEKLTVRDTFTDWRDKINRVMDVAVLAPMADEDGIMRIDVARCNTKELQIAVPVRMTSDIDVDGIDNTGSYTSNLFSSTIEGTSEAGLKMTATTDYIPWASGRTQNGTASLYTSMFDDAIHFAYVNLAGELVNTFSWDPETNTLSANIGHSNLADVAHSAETIFAEDLSGSTLPGSYPVMFGTPNQTGDALSASWDSAMTYTPRTDTLQATTFKGELDGNAKTATAAGKLAAPVKISLGGDASGYAPFDGSADVAVPCLLNSTGVVGGYYGPAGNVNVPRTNRRFTVPSFRVDEKGRVTEAYTRTVEFPFPEVDIDSELDANSTNPPQNRAVSAKFAEIDGILAVTPSMATATTTEPGLMSSADKVKLNSLTQLPRITTIDVLTKDRTGATASTEARALSDSAKTTLNFTAEGGISLRTTQASTASLSTLGVVIALDQAAVAGDGLASVDGKLTAPVMKGATATQNGTAGLVPASTIAQRGLYLDAEGHWSSPIGTTYSNATTTVSGLMSAADKAKLDAVAANATNVSVTRSLTSGTKIASIVINGASTDLYAEKNTDTTYTAFKGAGASTAGGAGLVPAPTAGKNKSYLRGDATWQSVYDASEIDSKLNLKANLASPTFTGTPKADTAAAGTKTKQLATTEFVGNATAAVVGADCPAGLDTLKEIAASIGNNTNFKKYVDDKDATKVDKTSVDYVKKLAISGRTITVTRGDNTTTTLTTQDNNTTYSNFVKSGSSAAAGLVPKPPTTAGTTKFLCEDGTWKNTTDTDNKVTNTLNTKAKAYITGTTSASTNTGGQIFDTGVFLTATAGQLQATTFIGALSGNASTATKLQTKRTINGVGFDGTGNITVADSTKVAKAGDTMTGNLVIKKATPAAFLQHTSVSKGSNPSSAMYWCFPLVDSKGTATANRLGLVETSLATNGNVSTYLRAYQNTSGSTTGANLVVTYEKGGTAYATCPQAAAGDRSTKIATTKWVGNLFHFSTSAPSNSTGANGDLWYQYV